MSDPIASKVHAGGLTAFGSGAGAATILVWIAGLYGVHIPPEVATAIGGVIGGFGAYLGGFVKKERRYHPT